MVRLTAMILLCSLLPLNARNAPELPPLTLTVTAGKTPKSLHLVLRNTSQAPVHILLGTGNQSRESLDAMVDPHGKNMRFEAFGFPMEGLIAAVNAEVAPGHTWSGNVDLQTLVLMDHLENPLTADQLEAGSYTIQAIFQGRTSSWPTGGRPYWLGTIQSPPLSYVLSK